MGPSERQLAAIRRGRVLSRAMYAMTVEELVRADQQLWASIVRRNAGRPMRRRYVADFWTANTRRLIREELLERERVLPSQTH